MKDRSPLNQIPPAMLDRAIFARTHGAKNPSAVHLDREFIPWVLDEVSGLWYSFDGNYSEKSPEEKDALENQRNEQYAKRKHEAEIKALDDYAVLLKWNKVRADVLERDQNTCQCCGDQRTGRLHIHHILKRRQGGTDHIDNLITVCNKCHCKADTIWYSPDWSKAP